PEIRKDGPDDPRVAAVGGSYGGGLSLLLAAADPRVDATVPMITWNDLARSFLPDGTGAGPENGGFKKQWAGIFFGSGGSPSAGAGLSRLGGADISGISGGAEVSGGADASHGDRGIAGDPVARARCGRFAADVCQAYLDMATTGRPTPEAIALLRRSSP